MFLVLLLSCAPHVGALEAPVEAAGVTPVAHQRRVYGHAAPGSADALHNAAVAAERVGDLVEALALAQEAYVADPDRRRHRYVQLLEGRLAELGGLAAIP